MQIGIVTPSFNQGSFLEETIDSVLSQGFPDLQYVIIDGGSTDNSVEIIRKYEKFLVYWVSEKDRGQSHAINKGLRHLSSEIWAYLNSDDTYRPGTFKRIASEFLNPEVHWVTGRGIYVDEHGAPLVEMVPIREWNMNTLFRNAIAAPLVVAVQVSNFMRRSVLQQYGYFDESLHYVMDVEFGLRVLLAGVRPAIIDDILASARLHSQSKTVLQESNGHFAKETAQVLERIAASKRADGHLGAISAALEEYRRQELTDRISRAWQGKGRLHGLKVWANATVHSPSLLAHRPALGLLRRIVTQWH